MGSTGSRLLSGNSSLVEELEDKIAAFKFKESALFFNSGYQLNNGIIPHIVGESDVVFGDKYIHASMVEGTIRSKAKLIRFKHQSLTHLESLLKKNRLSYKKALIMIESLYSMDGDKAPLEELIQLSKDYNCELYVDEAHAIGVYGENGEGLISKKLAKDISYHVGTFGKAFGSSGAFIACSESFKESLINSCKAFIYSTALPLPVISWNLSTINLMPTLSERRETLISLCDYAASLFSCNWESYICPYIVGDSEKTIELSLALKEKGIWTLPIRPPTVQASASRLRLSLTYWHTKSDLDALYQAIKSCR
jgi:8-amino-7-oxononanoate synthase